MIKLYDFNFCYEICFTGTGLVMRPIFLIFTLGFVLFFLFILYIFHRFSQGWSFQALFKDFNRKIWMTLCLGCLFFIFYLLIVGLSAYFVQQEGTNLLFLAYHHPVELVYAGLWLFACLSLCIYLARMVIKYFYLTRGKDR